MEALDIAASSSRLILMDIQLPEVSGLEVTKWLKEDDTLKSIPVVAVTAFAMRRRRSHSPGRMRGLYLQADFGDQLSGYRAPLRRLGKRHDGHKMTARVLVVDDILSNVKLLEAKLSAEYFEVITAFNGLECLARWKDVIPDIVLLDVMMPAMDGFEVCRPYQVQSQNRHVPVVMVTALDQPSDRVTGLDAGADDFLTKPVGRRRFCSRGCVRWCG